MKELTEGAFAKVNLTLDVLDKREDGYHNLRSIMQTVSLHDDVHVTVGCEGWQIHCYREVLPPDADENTEPELVTCGLPQDRENLAWKAAEAFYARIGKKPEGLEIFINKRIPLEAGLGGGSADAAAVLRALNRAYDSPLSIPALCELGAQVGSDVPFCVMGGTALVEGKGELLTRLPPAPERNSPCHHIQCSFRHIRMWMATVFAWRIKIAFHSRNINNKSHIFILLQNRQQLCIQQKRSYQINLQNFIHLYQRNIFQFIHPTVIIAQIQLLAIFIIFSSRKNFLIRNQILRQ